MPELDRVYAPTTLEIELADVLERLLAVAAPHGTERASLEPTFTEVVTAARLVLGKARTVPPIDLSRYSEATRRALYDQLVAIESAPDPDLPDAPPFDPDAADLTVFYLFGRWFAAWTDLDAPPDWPEAQRREVVTIHPADAPDGIVLHEV